MKKHLFIPIYSRVFKKPPFIPVIEKYFFDLHSLNPQSYIVEDLSFNKKNFIKNYNFINRKKTIYKKQIINNLKKNNFFFNSQIDMCIDYWLVTFLSTIKIRYDKIAILKKKYKNLSLPSYSFKEFSFDRTEDFMSCFRNDSLNNIYIFQQIAKTLEIPLINFNNKILVQQYFSTNYSNNLKFYLIKFLLSLKKINLSCNLYNRKSNYLLRFWFYLKKGILNIDESTFKLSLVSSKNSKKIDIKIKENDIFDKVVNKFLSDFFPKALYSEKYLFRMFNMQKRIKTLSSSISLISSEDYRILASFLGKQKVNTYQHGSDYGSFKYNLLEDFEKNNSKFFSWKNTESHDLFFNKILSYKKKILVNRNKVKNNTIILFTRIVYNNFLRLESNNIDFKSNLDLISKSSTFFNCLNNKLKKNLIIRNQKHDYGWKYKEKFFRYLPSESSAKFFNSSSSIRSMVDSKIFVADHISTSMYEVLQLNIPFFIYSDFQKNLYQTKENKLFLLLKKNNIIFDTPKDCADFLNNHYDNIEKFWYSKKTQGVLKKFKLCFFKK